MKKQSILWGGFSALTALALTHSATAVPISAEIEEVSVTFSLVQSRPGLILKGGNTESKSLFVVQNETEKSGTISKKFEAKKVDAKITNSQVIAAVLSVSGDMDGTSGWKIEAYPNQENPDTDGGIRTLTSNSEESEEDESTTPYNKGRLTYTLKLKHPQKEYIDFATIDVGPMLTFKGSVTQVEKQEGLFSDTTSGSGTYLNGFSVSLLIDGGDNEVLRSLSSLGGTYTGGVKIESYATDSDSPKIKDGVALVPQGGKIAVNPAALNSGGGKNIRVTGSITLGKSRLELKEIGGEDFE